MSLLSEVVKFSMKRFELAQESRYRTALTKSTNKIKYLKKFREGILKKSILDLVLILNVRAMSGGRLVVKHVKCVRSLRAYVTGVTVRPLDFNNTI